ncbi:hypothetical protein RRG08_032611 [Elysia crispata]|uniref:Uncharacterized protein n=1 Tax=Elysia crispata TaxID=231223 RepID=A0AAE1CPY8_9GAST|nr:hypothetical protein RRG08_032611 [Elysia crispata]
MGHMFLIVIDAHSKWAEAVPTDSSTSSKTIDILLTIFASSYWLIGTPSITLQENLQPGCSLAGAHASASIVSGHHCLRKSHKAKATKSDTILKLEPVFSTQEIMFSPATTGLQTDGPMAPLQLEMVHCPTVSRPHQASFGGDTLIRSCTPNQEQLTLISFSPFLSRRTLLAANLQSRILLLFHHQLLLWLRRAPVPLI